MKAETSRITVVWRTNRQTFENKVYWGISSNLTNVTFQTYSMLYMDIPNVHVVNIEGLTPSTQYYYRVYSDGTVSQIQTFTTAKNEDQSIRFAALADTQPGNDVTYTYDMWYENATNIANGIAELDIDHVLHMGDITFWGNDPTHWNQFFTVSSYLKKSAFYPIPGNHDILYTPLYPMISLFLNYFSIPAEQELWYSFDSGPIHFIGLDTSLGILHPLWEEQYSWLIADLQANDKPWTVVFTHRPLFSTGKHGNNYLLINNLHSLFRQYNITIVFSGHDHGFQHNKVNGIHYIVSGGGGGSLYDVGSSWFTIFAEKIHHFCYITANQTTILLEAINGLGETFYSFSLDVTDSIEIDAMTFKKYSNVL